MLPPFSLKLTPQRTLQTVLGLRAIALLAQLAVLILAVRVAGIALPVAAMLAGSGVLGVAAVLSVWRLRRGWPVTEFEVFGHLLLDIGVLSWLFFLSGGSSNPFVSAYLVPIALAAVALRPRYVLLVTAVCVLAYSLLFRFHVPLPPDRIGADGGFALHVFGMWLNFILSAGLIGVLVMLLAEAIRHRDRLIARGREDALRNEHVVALGALAAGAAHELSTPLSTVALLADELAAELADREDLRADLELLKQQVRQCKASLSALLAGAGQPRLEAAEAVTVERFLRQTLDRWRLLRPGIDAQVRLQGTDAARLLPDPALSQALISLLNNAADASEAAGSRVVVVSAALEEGQLRLRIEDEGAGIGTAALAKAGRAVFSTKPGGNGLGLLLSNATLERLGGQLSLHRRAGGGTMTLLALALPLAGRP